MYSAFSRGCTRHCLHYNQVQVITYLRLNLAIFSYICLPIPLFVFTLVRRQVPVVFGNTTQPCSNGILLYVKPVSGIA